MRIPLIVIGGGLSGLAAATRFARFIPQALILEQHSRPGGLNSYYYRNGSLLETGLHAITNYAPAGNKKAPLNRLLRQLKLDRDRLRICSQLQSEISFPDGQSLLFANDPSLLTEQIAEKFPASLDPFIALNRFLDDFDPFRPAPFTSARAFLTKTLTDPLLVDMLLCPLMYYGSSLAGDMDLGQFAIMFQAIYREGMFRPAGSIKDFLDLLLDHYRDFGGEIRYQSKVVKILHHHNRVSGVELQSGEVIECDALISTAGHLETRQLLGLTTPAEASARLGFIESIFQMPLAARDCLPTNRTIVFFNSAAHFRYAAPEDLVDLASGVICLPFNFAGYTPGPHIEVRTTHLASYRHWRELNGDPPSYAEAKRRIARQSLAVAENLIGNFSENIVYEDTFTPLTIERYTAKIDGAIYGSPQKIKDGDIGFANLFLAGTDQGFLGIVGSMLSGVSMVNQHILPKS